MIYLTDNYDLLKWTGVTEENLGMENMSIDELKLILNIEKQEFISLISEPNIANTLENELNIRVQVNKCIKAFLSPNDMIIYVTYVQGELMLTKIELETQWTVDFYSKEKKLIKKIELGNMKYSQAVEEACIHGLGINYDLYDLYYVV